MHAKTAGRFHTIQLQALMAALNANFLPSIDAMLEYREDLRSIGKQLMASLLLDEESFASAADPKDDWMSLIFEHMAADARSIEEFTSNPVAFVTFNYDRWLEYRLIRGLVERYSLRPEPVWDAVRRFGFVHLHGSLGVLPEQASPSTRQEFVRFGAPPSEGLGLVLQIADRSVHIVHDADQRAAQFDEAKQLLRTAEQIFFLGFGFGKINAGRLELSSIHPAIPIFCTTYDMTSAEVADSVRGAFPQHGGAPQLQTEGTSIRQFLRDRVSQFR
jgi:hypothetical protein